MEKKSVVFGSDLELEPIPNPACIWRFAAGEAHVLATNSRYRALFSCGKDAVLLPNLPPDERRRALARLDRHGLGRRELEYTGPAIRRDGASCRVRLCAAWLRDDAGAPVYLGVFRDISETMRRQQAEMQHIPQSALPDSLRWQQELLEAVAFHSGRMVFRYDIRSHTVYLGDTMARRFGLPPILTNITEDTLHLSLVSPETHEAYRGFFRAIASGAPSGATRIQHRDVTGAYAWYQVNFTTLYEADGPACAIISFAEITGNSMC